MLDPLVPLANSTDEWGRRMDDRLVPTTGMSVNAQSLPATASTPPQDRLARERPISAHQSPTRARTGWGPPAPTTTVADRRPRQAADRRPWKEWRARPAAPLHICCTAGYSPAPALLHLRRPCRFFLHRPLVSSPGPFCFPARHSPLSPAIPHALCRVSLFPPSSCSPHPPPFPPSPAAAWPWPADRHCLGPPRWRLHPRQGWPSVACAPAGRCGWERPPRPAGGAPPAGGRARQDARVRRCGGWRRRRRPRLRRRPMGRRQEEGQLPRRRPLRPRLLWRPPPPWPLAGASRRRGCCKSPAW